jgi:hypothetical protein
MLTDDLTLFPVFESLRKQGVPLGISEYLAVVEVLRQGYGENQPEKVERLCRLVWAKSQDDQELFDLAFARLARPRLEDQTLATKNAPKKIEKNVGDELLVGREGKSGSGSSEPPVGEIEEEEHITTKAFTFSAAWEESGEDLTIMTPTRFQLTPSLPIGIREMATAWRHLRLPQRSGPALELDVEGTLDDISRRGLFLGPRMRPRRRNQADLVVLLDVSDTMVPFSPLVDILLESIVRVGLLNEVKVYYFQEYPREVFFEQPGLNGEVPLEDVMRLQAAERSVLIVSEGGAALGSFDSSRLHKTHSFLQVLDSVTYLYAWLNPLPPERWQGTTAGAIARLAPMFTMDRDGLNDTVNILRGYPFPPTVNLSKANLDAISS